MFGTHNHYLQIVLEQGLAGLALFIGWLAAVLMRGYRILSDSIADGKNAAVLLILPGFCGVLVAFIFAHTTDVTILTIVAMFGSLLGNQEPASAGSIGLDPAWAPTDHSVTADGRPGRD
jgi:O-antigen ligase